MKRQNLREREAAIILDQISGKATISEIRDHLKANGFIDVPDDVQDVLELEQARRFVQATRDYLDGKGNLSQQFFHFTETLEDGTKSDYYRKFSELTIGEGVQLINEFHDRSDYWAKKMRRFYMPLRQRFGVEFEGYFSFSLPEIEPKPAPAKQSRKKIATPSVN